MYKTKLQKLKDNRHKIPDEFWLDGAFWFYEETSGGYSWSSQRLGMKRNGDIVWAFDSGCSCNSEWENFNVDVCDTATTKQFVLSNFLESAKEYDYGDDGAINTQEKDVVHGIDQFLLLVSDDVDPQDVLKIENAEIRRYMIKRVGYENIKSSVKAKVLHTDGDNQLLKFANDEMYVKVKDSSTDREYLLFVEGNHKTCRSAIAWTFGLTEEEYNPVIET